jgi:CheY-like chemotaxis protein
MQRSKEISAHIPMLRRFSRLLMGGQKAGDVLVLATLQQFANDEKVLSNRHDLKSSLYQSLIRMWSTPSGHYLSDKSKTSIGAEGADRKLRRLPEISRAVFLLTHLDDFSADKAQWILDLDKESFDQCVGRANEEVNYLLATDVMIIEDEMLIATQLEALLRSLGHGVTTVVRTAKQAIAAAKKQPPKLILSDIQLADGSSGVDAVAAIVRETPCPAIFITAFPERLLTGGRPEPAFLLSKPFKVEQIKAVVSQAVFFDTRIRWKLTNEELTGVLAQDWGGA